MNEQLEAWMTEQQFDETEKALFRKYYPLAWNKPTAHAEVPGTIITTVPHLFRHARAEEERIAAETRLDDARTRTQAREQRINAGEQSAEWVHWHAACQARKQRIADAKAAWRKAVADADMQRAQLNAIVSEARSNMVTAEAEPVPTRPTKR